MSGYLDLLCDQRQRAEIEAMIAKYRDLAAGHPDSLQ
jgi:hypothetical protein